MPQPTIRRALLSVYDKTGLVDFARALHEEFSIDLVSTGGTARTLRDAGLPVTLVEEITGFPEMMDGRVKTLHPKIHGAILADRDNPDHMRQLAEQGIEPIDMVVVNLYPFEDTIAKPDCTFEQAIEMIDIGGPCLLRAAAKNSAHVLVVPEPEALPDVLRALRDESGITQRLRLELAARVFSITQDYDMSVCIYLVEQRLARAIESAGYDDDETRDSGATDALINDENPVLYLRQVHRPRYGENPHQQAAVCVEDEEITQHAPPQPSVAAGAESRDTEMSFNNYADAGAALELCAELTRANPAPAACFIKHTNPCGAAVHTDPREAYRNAYLGDPNAAMGGILAVNFPVDAAFAETVLETYQRFGKPLQDAGHPNPPGAFFVEVWIAPEFSDEAVRIIRGDVEGKPQKAWGRRVRLIAVGDLATPPDPEALVYRSIAGGMLAQTPDLVGLNEDEWKVVSQRKPTDQERDDLRLAWLVCKHTKSNAISICKDGRLLGNGAGQMSRVMSCRIATWLAKENGHDLANAVAASDAFFPFRDGPDILMGAGITALIQPGGSKRDQDTIAACNQRNIAMIFTGTRHFRH